MKGNHKPECACWRCVRERQRQARKREAERKAASAKTPKPANP